MMETRSLNEPLRPCSLDFQVTEERVHEVVRRLVDASNPQRVIAFGSWARKQLGPQSDLDLALIYDSASTVTDTGELYGFLRGVGIAVDLLAVSEERYALMRESLNSVYYDIAREGLVLYERDANESADRRAA